VGTFSVGMEGELLSCNAWLAIANGESESSAVGLDNPPYIVRDRVDAVSA
jgi:hypothetical protein